MLTCASSRLPSALSSRSRASRFLCRPTLALQRLTKPQLQLARRLFGERHRDDVLDPRAAGGQHAQDALDEFGRLAGPGRRFDDQRVVERIGDVIAGVLIG